MIIYYQDRSVQVTSDAVQIDDQHYPFDQLERVWHARQRRSWREVAGRGAWGLAYLLPFVGAVAGFLIAFSVEASIGARATIVVAAILVGLSAGPLIDPILGKLDDSFDRGLHQHEIWVMRHGMALRVFETRDAARFGRIYRAVQRAAEQRGAITG